MKHPFYECPITNKILNKVLNYIHATYNMKVKVNILEMITGLITDDEEQSTLLFRPLLMTIIKQKIYAMKCTKRKITTEIIVDELEFIHDMDKNMAYITGRVKKIQHNTAQQNYGK